MKRRDARSRHSASARDPRANTRASPALTSGDSAPLSYRETTREGSHSTTSSSSSAAVQTASSVTRERVRYTPIPSHSSSTSVFPSSSSTSGISEFYEETHWKSWPEWKGLESWEALSLPSFWRHVTGADRTSRKKPGNSSSVVGWSFILRVQKFPITV